MERLFPTETTPNISTESTVQEYWTYLKSAYLNPSWLFQQAMGHPASLVLAYGTISAWLSHIFGFILETVNSLFFNKFLEGFILEVIDPSLISGLSRDTFLWSSGTVLLAPFLILLRVLSGSVLLYIFSNLLVEKSDPSRGNFKSYLKIQGIALHATWLQLIPIFGSLISFVATIILLVTGLKNELHISSRRASLIVLAPLLLLIFAIVCLSVLGLILLTQLPLEEILLGVES